MVDFMLPQFCLAASNGLHLLTPMHAFEQSPMPRCCQGSTCRQHFSGDVDVCGADCGDGL